MDRHTVKEAFSDRIFNVVNYSLLFVVLIIAFYPIWFVIIASFSDPDAVSMGQVLFIPKGFNINGYKSILSYPYVFIGYRNSIFYSAIGTFLNVSVTTMAAYALSRRDLFGRGLITGVFAFTMFFSGGLIPTFMTIKKLGLYDKPYTLLVLGLVTMSNIIITRTFMSSSIPLELQESAKMDGCSDFKLFFRIILPLSKPVIAVISIYYAVGHWNSYFSGLIYLNNRNYQPLQVFLREILVLNQVVEFLTLEEMQDYMERARTAQILKYSLIIASSIPMIIIYPFAQKYFVKGVMIGAIKG